MCFLQITLSANGQGSGHGWQLSDLNAPAGTARENGYEKKDHWHWSGRPKWHYLPGVDCPTSDTPPPAGSGDPALKTAKTLTLGYLLYRGYECCHRLFHFYGLFLAALLRRE